MADVLADIEQFDVEIGATEPLAFSADTDNDLQLTAEDYKVIIIRRKVQPDSISWRSNSTVTYVAGELIDTSNIGSFNSMFSNCGKLEEVDTSEWVTDKVKDVGFQFWQNASLKALDMSNWNLGACTNISPWIVNCYSLRTLIGNHTLDEVESGKIVAIKDVGKSVQNVIMSWQANPRIRYASILAVALGLYDRTGLDTGTWQISNSAFAYCYNDDDAKPDADTITERQARIRAICAEKNYNLVLS